jgi:hypothetical protein
VNVAKVRTNHPKISLAKFGYILEMKVGGGEKGKKKEKRIVLYYWLLSNGTYHENLVILKKEK